MHRATKLTAVIAVLSSFASGTSLSCASRPAMPERDEALRAQLRLGADTYRLRCQSCHDVEEEAGQELSAEIVGSYFTARSLRDYIDISMPYDEPGSLSEAESWAVTAFLVTERQLAVLRAPLDRSTGDSLRISVSTVE